MVYILRRRRLGRTSCKGISERSTKGILVVRSDLNIPEDGLCVRWGCTADVPTRNVVNTAAAIHEVNDKLSFRRKLNEAELCPPTWFDLDTVLNEIRRAGGTGEFPEAVIVRPRTHSRGRDLHVCRTPHELVVATHHCGPSWYASPLINKVAEYRVFVVSGRVICVAQKTPGNPDDVAWNVAKGGRFDNVSWDRWPLKAVRTSVEAFNLSALDFGGVDVMIAEDGSCSVLEINSAPSLTSPYRQECMAKALDYIIDNGKDRLPLIEARGGYKKFIHPAVCDRATLVEEV